MLAFRNGVGPQLYDSPELDVAVQQAFFFHLSGLHIMCIIPAGVTDDFLAVMILYWSLAPSVDMFSIKRGSTRKTPMLPCLDLWLGGGFRDLQKRRRALCRFGPKKRVDVGGLRSRYRI